jgi:hypothetical protein
MSTLPAKLVELTSGQSFVRRTFTDLGLAERALDEIVERQADVIADLLIENGVIEDGSRLRYLGRQFRRVDVLFAEVDEEDEPTRLVLVEDKLLRDPGASRKVIGQIVEYAARFQDEVTSSELEEYFPDQRQWLKQNAETLDRQIERGDFLLIVCGDSIHSNVADIVSRLARRADRYPLSGMELCLIGMDVYERGDERILIPHVIGTVVRAERQLEIRIVDSTGSPLRAVAETSRTAIDQGRGRPATDFFEAWKKRFGANAVADWQAFIDQISDADVPGLIVSKTSIGRPTIKLRSARAESLLPVLRTRVSAPGIRDVCGTRTWERTPLLAAARDEFRATLRRIPGGAEKADHTVLLPIERARAEAAAVIAALRQLSRQLEAE